MNLSELTPDEQRARIEGWLRTYAGCIGPDYFAAQNIEFLCRLALRALPPVVWKHRHPGSNREAAVYGYKLSAYRFGPGWAFAISAHLRVLESGTAPTLKAAQKDCVDALWKLLGGGE